MRKILTSAACLALATYAWAQVPARKPSQNKTAARTGSAATPVRRTTATTAAARRTSTRKAPVVRTTWRTRQAAPSADRYREIQEALAARGYLSPAEANGTWGPSSTEALKRFQAEQTLGSTGKIDSLSLIALGLGPKHDSSPAPRMADGYAQPESGRN